MSDKKNVCVGVVGAIIERDGKFLLMKEIQRHIPNHPDDGKWNLPAGRLEHGDDPIEAIRKEVIEETGYAFEPTHVLGVYSLVRKDIEQELGTLSHVLKITFVGTTSANPVVSVSDDSAGIQWFSAEEIQAMDRHVLRGLDIKAMIKDYRNGVWYPLNMLTHTVSPRD